MRNNGQTTVEYMLAIIVIVVVFSLIGSRLSKLRQVTEFRESVGQQVNKVLNFFGE